MNQNIDLRLVDKDSRSVYKKCLNFNIFYKNRKVGEIKGIHFNLLKAYNHTKTLNLSVSIENIICNTGENGKELWQQLELIDYVKHNENTHAGEAFRESFITKNIYLVNDFSIDKDMRDKDVFLDAINMIPKKTISDLKAFTELIVFDMPPDNELLRLKVKKYLENGINFDQLGQSRFLFHFYTHPTK